jgi:hypothetical protein
MIIDDIITKAHYGFFFEPVQLSSNRENTEVLNKEYIFMFFYSFMKNYLYLWIIVLIMYANVLTALASVPCRI